MKPFSRSDRVSGQIQKVLSELLHKKIKDPRLDVVTITAVKMSRDLKLARIYFVVWGDRENREAVDEGFKSARGYLKRTLAQELGLRYMPDIKFFYDDSFDYGSNIDKVLKLVKTENGSDRQSLEEE